MLPYRDKLEPVSLTSLQSSVTVFFTCVGPSGLRASNRPPPETPPRRISELSRCVVADIYAFHCFVLSPGEPN